MKSIIIISIYTFLGLKSQSQVNKGVIDVNSYIRNDWYPQFSYPINSINTNFVDVKGTSWGLNLSYKKPLPKSLFIKMGIGYYRHSFNHMDNFSTMFGANSSRNINYSSTLFIPFYTDKYWYNCISAIIGLDKHFLIKRGLHFRAGLSLENYYTFSQLYHITYNNPDNIINNNYRKSESGFFGISTNMNYALLIDFGKIRVGPNFLIPVYDIWRQDEIFLEENNSKFRNKWFRGIGVGLKFEYLIKK